MKVKVEFSESEDGVGGYMAIYVNGKRELSINADPECPEDFTFFRNLSDCHNIPDLMEMAYKAGKNGEQFELEWVDE